MAGRALENGGNIALQNLGQPERAADMYKRASDLFMQNMTPDRAAEMLEKSAKYIIVFSFISTGIWVLIRYVEQLPDIVCSFVSLFR